MAGRLRDEESNAHENEEQTKEYVIRLSKKILLYLLTRNENVDKIVEKMWTMRYRLKEV